MKKQFLKIALLLIFPLAVSVASCKNEAKEETTDATNDTEMVIEDNNVDIADDETLQQDVQDAVKDFEGVSATVADGVITLTGDIKRDRLPQLMQHLNNLNPKRIDNNLNIQD